MRDISGVSRLNRQTCTMLAPLLFLCLSQIVSSNFPPPIKKCKDDNTLIKCILDQAPDVIKTLAKGNPQHRIMVLDPFIIPKIEQTSSGMNLTMEDINVIGLSKAELVDAEISASKEFLRLLFHVSQIKVDSNYTLIGKFVIPMKGKGKCTTILYDVSGEFICNFKLIKKKGVEYLTTVPPNNLSVKPKSIAYNFENLFDGNKELGDAANKVMNENWEEFYNQLGQAIPQAMVQMMTNMIKSTIGTTPLNELFEKP